MHVTTTNEDTANSLCEPLQAVHLPDEVPRSHRQDDEQHSCHIEPHMGRDESQRPSATPSPALGHFLQAKPQLPSGADGKPLSRF